MTDTSAPAEVVQADRDAAAEYALNQLGLKEAAERLRSGGMDDHSTVQAFARHRLNTRPVASTLDAETVEACAKVADQRLQLAHDGYDLTGFSGENRAIRAVAAAIRALSPGKTGSAGVGEG